jgi:hypothetical protein
MKMYRADVQVYAEAVILANSEEEALDEANDNLISITDLSTDSPDITISEITKEEHIPRDWREYCPVNDGLIPKDVYKGNYTSIDIFNFYNEIRKEEERHQKELDAMGNLFEWAKDKNTANVCSKNEVQKGEGK